MNVAQAVADPVGSVPPWVVLGLLLVAAPIVLVLGYTIFMQYSRQRFVMVLLTVSVMAVMAIQLWYMQNVGKNFAGWEPEALERYDLAVAMQVVAVLLCLSVLLGLAFGAFSSRSLVRYSAVWALLGQASLTFGVGVELTDFANELVAPSAPDYSTRPLALWVAVVGAVFAGWFAYLARPGDRVRYPWYWYAAWMGAASPFAPVNPIDLIAHHPDDEQDA